MCGLRLYPATPGWGVRFGCVCFGSAFGCAPPLLAGMLGCVYACVRALLVPRHSWLGCAVLACVLGLVFWLGPASPYWGVGVCVLVCALRLYPATPGWVVRAWARVLAAPRNSGLGCWGVRVCVPAPLVRTPGGVCPVCVCARARVSAAPRNFWQGYWALCAFVCALRAYPATPGWDVRCGCVCLGSGTGCTPPLLASVSGCVCACVRAPLLPRHSWLGFVVCGFGVAWHLFRCRGSSRVVVAARVCGTRWPLLLGTCPCALVVASGVPLWRAWWPRVVRRASSGPVALGALVSFRDAVVPFPTLGACAPGFTGWLRGARGDWPGTGLIVAAAGPRRGRGAGLAPRRTRSGPAMGLSLAGPSSVGLGLRVLGLSAGTPGLSRVYVVPSPCGSEDATPGSRACVRVLVLPGRVGRAGLPSAFWCASTFLMAALSFCFARPPPGWGCLFCGSLVAFPPPFFCFFSLLFCLPRAPLISFFLWFPSLGALAPCSVASSPPGFCFLFRPAAPPPSFLFRCLSRCRFVLCFFFLVAHPCCLWLSLVSGPGCPGP